MVTGLFSGKKKQTNLVTFLNNIDFLKKIYTIQFKRTEKEKILYKTVHIRCCNWGDGNCVTSDFHQRYLPFIA